MTTTNTKIATLPPADRAVAALNFDAVKAEVENLAAQYLDITAISNKAGRDQAHGAAMTLKGKRVEIQPALEGWIDCLARIDKKLPNRAMKQLSRYLGAGLTLTPELVTDARREFDAHLRRMRTMLPSQIKDAATTAQIAWEFEKMEKAA